jgi:anti-sigma B factor antagonist
MLQASSRPFVIGATRHRLMQPSANTFEIEQQGETAIVTPLTNLRELAYLQIEADMSDLLEHLTRTKVKNVVIDFQETDYFGTTALGWFVKLWKHLKARNGLVAFCSISEHEREVLRITKLDSLWPIYSSKDEAVRAVTGP